ncbi:hypothetical protein L2E82_30102 [Cichorium intybus]|uniref:Uncharacterized protein n=1 Tax=Cichorium intybus TaxID=13427 RepID=A0ACB9CZT2_CICIN|nr:hypothetical protein L2E82_30102 [Cichorium intybus]
MRSSSEPETRTRGSRGESERERTGIVKEFSWCRWIARARTWPTVASQLQSLYGHSFSYCLVDRDSNSSVNSKLIFGYGYDYIAPHFLPIQFTDSVFQTESFPAKDGEHCATRLFSKRGTWK